MTQEHGWCFQGASGYISRGSWRGSGPRLSLACVFPGHLASSSLTVGLLCCFLALLLNEIWPLTCVLWLWWERSGFYQLILGPLWCLCFAINNVLIQPMTNAHTDTHINLGLLLFRLYPGLFVICLCHLKLFVTLPLPPILLSFFLIFFPCRVCIAQIT